MARPILAAVLALALALPARAQAPAPGTAGALTPTASLRTRLEAWDWFGEEEEGEYAFLGTLLRAGVERQGERLGWQVELAAPILAGLPDDATLAAPRGQLGTGASYAAANGGDRTAAELFLKQAYLRVGSRAAGHSLRLGRFEFAEGAEVSTQEPTLAALKRDRVAQRLLGTFGWSHVGRSFDGAHYAHQSPGANVTLVAARPTQGVFDVDGWPELDVGVVYGGVTLPEHGSESPGESRLFALHYLDYREDPEVVKVDNRPLPARRADRERVEVTTLGGNYLRVLRGPAVATDLLLWGAYQTGRWGDDGHRAWAASGEVGFQPAALPGLRPWLRFGYFQSSGDPDPADGEHETFFQVLPTPRIHARTPFYNLMNLREGFASLTLRPSQALTLRADLRSLSLSSGADLWYAGGGAFEDDSFGYAGRPAGGEEGLATLYDLSAELRFGPTLLTTLYLGWARGGEVVERTFGDEGGGRLAYLEVEYRPFAR